MLAPATCRAQVGVPTRTWSTDISACTEEHLGATPPDRWARTHVDGMLQRGERPWSVTELMELMSNKRVIFLGDSITGQFFQAFRCLAAAAPIVPAIHTKEVDIDIWRLQQSCKELWNATSSGQSTNSCKCTVTERASWRGTHCADLLQQQGLAEPAADLDGRRRRHRRRRLRSATADFGPQSERYRALIRARERHSKLLRSANIVGFRRIPGFHSPTHNLTISYWCGDARLGLGWKTSKCPVCVQPPHSAVAGGACPVSDWCEVHNLPTQLALIDEQNVADIVVTNLGLHVHSRTTMANVLPGIFAELDAFGKRKGRAAIFHEVSNQHFKSQTGDYDDALSNDSKLERVNVSRLPSSDLAARRWMGPSLCQPHSGFGGYRNEQVRSLFATRRSWDFAIMPFEQLTRERWDYHSGVTWHPIFQKFVSDCTHFCFSPKFWELVAHDLFLTLSNASEWLRRRRSRLTTRALNGMRKKGSMGRWPQYGPAASSAIIRLRPAGGFASTY